MLCRRSLSRALRSTHSAATLIFFIIAGLLVTGLGRPLAAQTTTAAPRTTASAASITLPAGVSRIVSIEGITEYRLENGLRVLLFPDNSKPTITVNITYLVGSRHEGYGETGMAHLIEHMIFKGTPKHKDIPQELTAHGTRPNGTTWLDRTNYFETFTSTEENLDWALDLEADRMVNSNMSGKDLASEFTVVRNEFEVGENHPQSVLLERVVSAAYLWHNYGKSTIGSRADIERVPIERLQAFYKTWYQPDNAVLVVAGDIDEAKALAKVAGVFGAIPKPTRPLPNTYTIEPAQDGERTVALKRVGDVQVVVAAYHIPAGSHPDFEPISILSYILTDSPSGRLHKELVETRRAAMVFGWPYQMHDPGILNLIVEVRLENSLDEARDILLRVAEGLATTPPTQEEVNRAREALLTNWETTMRNSEWAARDLSEWSAMGDWRLMFVHRDRLKAVTPADVARVAAAYLRPENRTVGLYIPTKEPARAEIPETPDVRSLVENYKGEEALTAGEAFVATPANIESRLIRVNLDPGISLVMLPKKSRGGTVSGMMTFHMGDAATLKGRSAAAGLAGSLLMRGSTLHTRQQINDEFDRLRAQAYVYGSATQAGGGFEVTRENLPGTLRLIAELLRKPAFPDTEFAQLVQEYLVIYEDMRKDPQQLASTELNKHLNPWPKDDPRYVKSPDEQIASLKTTTVDDARGFHRDFYGASNAEIAIAGDFDAAEVQALLKELFGDWKSPRPYTRLASEFVDRPAINKTIETPDKESASMMAGLRFAARDDDPEYAALQLGSFMLGGGFLNSRLAMRLRQKDGLSYGVGSSVSVSSFERNGTFRGYAIYAPQNSDRLVTGFREEIVRALDKGFTDQEIAEAKTGWLQQQQVGRASDRELVGRLASLEFQKRTLAWDEALEAKVSTLTNDEIVAALRKYIDPKKISIVQAGDFAKAKKAAAGQKSGAVRPQ